ncbi:hypothetical protein D020_2728A, partial [Vibrio parahaemolyticus SBR10290]
MICLKHQNSHKHWQFSTKRASPKGSLF